MAGFNTGGVEFQGSVTRSVSNFDNMRSESCYLSDKSPSALPPKTTGCHVTSSLASSDSSSTVTVCFLFVASSQ